MRSGRGSGTAGYRLSVLVGLGQKEPEESVTRQSQSIKRIRNGWEIGTPQQVNRNAIAEARQIEIAGLRIARQIEHADDRLALMLPQIGKDLAVAGIDKGERAAAESAMPLAHADYPLHPIEQRTRAMLLSLHVDGLVPEDRVLDRRKVKSLRISSRESAVAIDRPLHRRPDAVAIAQENVVAHADLVAVVENRRPRHREQ